MQTMTQTLIDAIRSDFQIPIADVILYESDGTEVGSIADDVLKVSVDVSGSRKIKRTLSITLDNSGGKYSPDPDIADNNVLWYNKRLKIFFGYKTGTDHSTDETLPQGVYVIDELQTSLKRADEIIDVKALDLMSILNEDKFDDIYVVEDTTATETENWALSSLGSTATASTELSSGDEIQKQARVYSVDTTAVINGIEQTVDNESGDDPGSMIDGSTSTIFLTKYTPKSGETVTEIRSEIFIDLKEPEDLQQITINLTNGGALTDYVYLSEDNSTWSTYTTTTITPSAPVRFIKFNARKTSADADGSFSFGVSEIQILTANNFPAAQAIDGDYLGSSWRPTATDANPEISVDLGGSHSLNVIYLSWGMDSFDFNSRINYYMEYSSDSGATWSRITDLNGYDETSSFYGDMEHVFNDITATNIRIKVTGWDGSIRLRHIMAKHITATQTVDQAMIDVLTGAGITDYQIPKTRRYISSIQADIGEEKAAFLNRLSNRANWTDPDFNEDGVFFVKKRDIDPISVAWTIQTSSDNIYEFNPSFSNGIKNVIVVVYSGSDQKAIVGRAIDDNPLSPTFIGILGRRVQKYETDSVDTQEKADRYAQELLFNNTRLKHSSEIPTSGHPGYQTDDVVAVTIEDAKVSDVKYIVTGYVSTYQADPVAFDTKVNLSQI